MKAFRRLRIGSRLLPRPRSLTPDDGHEFQLDFPRLMLRYTAQQAKRQGVSIRDRFLGNPVALGKLSSKAAPIVNAMNKSRAHRALMEKTLGIHRDKVLPDFASEPFEKWLKKRASKSGPAGRPATREAVLFHTCYVNYNAPEIGKDAVEVLERSGVRVLSPTQTCCGMPALDGGDVARATDWARQNVEILLPYVEAGCDIVAPGPTCSFMIKHEWKDYLGTAQAETVAARAFDLMEYLFNLRKEGALADDFSVELGEIGYHLACHLKVQKIGFRSRDVLKKLPGTTVKLVDKCSCMDGTWGMKKEWYDLSVQGAQPLLEGMTEGRPDTLASDCLIAKLQIEERTGQQVLHPIELLWKAYGGRIEEKKK